MPAGVKLRAKFLREIKELAETIAIVRHQPLQSVEELTVSRANEFVNGKAWADALKREEELVNAQFEAVKAVIKTVAAGSNAVIKGLGSLVGR